LIPLRLDESGADVGVGRVSIAIGGLVANCSDWTNSTANFGGTFADRDELEDVSVTANCTSLVHLRCFATDDDEPVTMTPATGRKAFVTTQFFVAQPTGIAAADALCAQEASLAGIRGSFLALLSTSTAPASSRFDLGGSPWVRLDGLPLAATALDFMGGNLVGALDLTSTGTSYTGPVITGGLPVSTAGPTCMDYVQVAGSNARGGLATSTTHDAFDAVLDSSRANCNGIAPIYCLEQ
jgi:hypothetical protein